MAATASVVAVAASSPVVEAPSAAPASTAPRGAAAFPGTFASAANAQPDCHSASNDYVATEDTPLAEALVCTDPDADPLTYALTAAPAHGVVTIDADGHFTYAPSPNYSGPDSFQFQAQDPGGALDAGTATLTVTAVNDPPVANPDSATIAEDGGTVTTPNVLANDGPGGGADEAGQALMVNGFTQPAHGRVVNNGDGTFAYTPNANFNGTDTFTYDVTDDGATGGSPDPRSSTGTVTITVTPVNDAPVANDDTYSTGRNAAVSISAPGLLGNDTDVEGDPLSAVEVAGPAHGTATVDAGGSFTYTPATGFVGTDFFTYKANDGAADSNVATVSISVGDTAPVAVSDTFTAQKNVPRTIAAPGLLANDTDADGDPLTAVEVADPAHGSVTVNPVGSFTYTPATDFVGTDSFTYKANDGVADSGVATVSVDVQNTAPAAENDSFTAQKNVSRTIPAPGVLANDTDANGDSLSAAKVGDPAHGSVTVNANGSLTYTPAADYVGTDSFTYAANDGAADSNVATVSISVQNTPPVARDDSYQALKNVPRTIAAPGVLANDSDANGDPLTAVKFANPSHGTVALAADGSFTYTPATGFVGDDSFTYKANDGSDNSGLTTVVMHVVNQPPVAQNDAYAAQKNVPLTVSAPGLLANDTDANGDALTAVKLTDPAHGTVTVNANGSFTYTPAAGYAGADSFTYKADDGAADSEGATVAIAVRNTAPAAANDSYAVSEDNALAVSSASGLLANDTDANGDALTAVKVTDPAHGTVTLSANGSFTYTPSPNFNGSDSFTYKANDGTADSSPATVALDVRPVNDAPVATSGPASASEDTPLTIDLRGFVSDVETAKGDLTYTIVSGPAHGTLNGTGLPRGSFSYTPSANYSGADSFTYSVTDRGDPDNCSGGLPDCAASLTSETKTVAITVNPGNDKPVAGDGATRTNEETAVGFDVRPLVSDLETPKAGLTYNVELSPAHGSVVNNHDGTFTYTPNANYNGPDGFSYSVTDRGDPNNCSGGPPSCAAPLTSDAKRVSITVDPINDAPSASDGIANANEDTPSTIDLRPFVADVETAPNNLVYTIVTSTRNGTLSPAAVNGTFTYTPRVIPNTGDSFTYSVSDRGDPDNCGVVRAGCDGALQTGVKTITMTIPNYVLNVGRTGTGSGVVTSSPAGINCGSDCSEPYGAGKLVTLTAAPASNSTLAGWSGACAGASMTCIVTMSSAKDVTADFAKKAHHLRVAKAGDGSGAVTTSPAGIDCGATCDAVFDEGTTVTLTAAAAANSSFEGWDGACSGSATTCTVTMAAAADVTARFKALKPPPPGPPVAAQSFVLAPVSGTVYYRKPGASASTKLTEPVKVPPATVVDAGAGVVNVKAAEGNGTIDSANFWAGVFRLDQYAYRSGRFLKLAPRTAKKTLVTQLTLVAGRSSGCGSKSQGGSAAKKPLRKLWGSAQGKFRMKGRYSSATVHGAKWYVEDDCAGTRTTVARGAAEVRDFVKKKNVLVRAGHSYFAAATRPKKR